MATAAKARPNCSVKGCKNKADYEVIFYDVYLHHDVDVFYEAHESCPYLCQEHLTENERQAETGLGNDHLRKYRGLVKYPHARSSGQGFCIYRPMS